MKHLLLHKIRRQAWSGLMLGMAVCLAAGCSDDDSAKVAKLASKITLTLSEYYNDEGGKTLHAWTKEDKGGIFIPGNGPSQKLYAEPIRTQSPKSLFLFTLEAPRYAEARLVGFYPVDADLTREGNTLKTVIPTTQTGKLTPCLVGQATGLVNSYEGYDLELRQIFCTMYLCIKQGDYSISKAILKSNGREAIAGEMTIDLGDGSVKASARTITVDLPTPIDCSEGARIIPVMVAPVTLPEGYTVDYIKTDGTSLSAGTTNAVELPAGDRILTDVYLPRQTISLGSYNLWVSTQGWAARRSLLARSIVDNKWDIFGFQEASATIREELPSLVEELGGHYEWWFVGRDSQDGLQGEAVGIAYNPDRFELADKRYFWISETPDILSLGWDEANYRRIACCATITDKVYGTRFFMMATHSPLAIKAQNEGAKLLIERERMYNPDGIPSILVGDMNAHTAQESAITLRTHWSDAFLSVDATLREGPVGTFNNHDPDKDLSGSAARIDFVYHRGEIEIKGYRCDNTLYNGVYPSDHCAVTIFADIPASPAQSTGANPTAKQ